MPVSGAERQRVYREREAAARVKKLDGARVVFERSRAASAARERRRPVRAARISGACERHAHTRAARELRENFHTPSTLSPSTTCLASSRPELMSHS